MKTADPELMRAINRFHVMDAIRRHGPVSRVQICEVTELSATTVSAITAALLDDRLISSLQVGAVRDAGRGRPRVMLQLNPDAAYVVGVCRQSPIFSDRDVPFGGDLTRRLGVPVSIDSDANLVALAEHWFGQARDLNDFLVVSVERSLGLGILHNGELFRGANGLSPDLGDLMVSAPGNGGGLLGDMVSDVSLLGDSDATLPSGRAMALLLRRADDGDKACLAALAAAGEAL